MVTAHDLRTVAARSQHGHSTVTARSQHGHGHGTARSRTWPLRRAGLDPYLFVCYFVWLICLFGLRKCEAGKGKVSAPERNRIHLTAAAGHTECRATVRRLQDQEGKVSLDVPLARIRSQRAGGQRRARTGPAARWWGAAQRSDFASWGVLYRESAEGSK